ncbi:MAG: tetratricopeptide repeat protein [Flavobacteriaceae bacterium]|nr:tetratricopeptide repeat protein [Flavobacteriaceae bacterium]
MGKLITFFLLFSFFSGLGQTMEKELKIMSDDACACIAKIEKNVEHKNRVINDCIQYSISKSGIKDIASSGNSDNPVIDTKTYSAIENELIKNCTALKSISFTVEQSPEQTSSQNILAQLAYDDGMDYLEDKNYKDAISKFKKATELDPKFAYAWDNLGISYRSNDQLDLALQAYGKSLEVNPKGKLAMINSAVVYNLQNNPEKAIQSYKTYAVNYPEDPEGYYGLGLIEYTNGQPEAGLDNLVHSYVLYNKQKSPYRT